MMSRSLGVAHPARGLRGDLSRIAPWLLMPVGIAAAAGESFDRPWMVAVAFAGLGLALAALGRARRLGGFAVWMGALGLSVLAGEMSAVGFGGQSGRLLWADAVFGIGFAWALLGGGFALVVPRAPFLIALGPLIAWSLLTLLVARDVLTGAAELKEWLVAMGVATAAACFASDARRARTLLQIVAVTGTLIATHMLVVAMHSPFGWVLAVLLKKVDLPWGRTNYLAGILILSIPVTVGLYSGAASLPKRLGWLALLVGQSVGLGLSASKGAILSLVAGFAVAYLQERRAAKVGALVMGAIVASGIALFAFGPLHEVVAYRLQASAVAYSVGERMNLYRLAWDEFLRSPIFGLGLNNFSVAANHLTGVDTVPHNLELGLLSELGLPGLALAMVWLTAIGQAAWRSRVAVAPAARALGLGLWAAFVAFFIHNQMESTLYGQQYKMLFMLVAAAAWRLGALAETETAAAGGS